MVGLAKAGDDEGALGQARVAGAAQMLGAVEDHVLVDLVADQQHIGGCQQGFELAHFRIGPDGGAGVVRAVDDQQARARRDGGRDPGKVGTEAAGRQRHPHGHAAGHLDIGHIAVVAGVEHDDFVARMHGGQDGGENGLSGAGGDGDFAARVIAAAVQRLDLGGYGLAQRGPARHGRVLVVTGAHGVVDSVEQPGVAAEVGEALAQIDGLVLGGQRRHDGENGGAHIGQLAGEVGSHDSLAMHGPGAQAPALEAGRIRARSRPRCRSWRA